MPRPAIHNREDPLSAPKYPQSHVTQYTGELLNLNFDVFVYYMVFNDGCDINVKANRY